MTVALLLQAGVTVMLLLQVGAVTGSSIADEFLKQGLLGAVTLLAIYVAYQKDKALQEERAGRLADAKAMQTFMLDQNGKTRDMIDKLADISDRVVERERKA